MCVCDKILNTENFDWNEKNHVLKEMVFVELTSLFGRS